MGKELINYTCGHEATVQLYGKHTERDRRVEWLGTQECPACREGSFARAGAAAGDENAKNGLPTLLGSAKQVAWAETIRKSAITEIADIISGALASIKPDTPVWLPDLIRDVGQKMINNNQSSYWIDRRNTIWKGEFAEHYRAAAKAKMGEQENG